MSVNQLQNDTPREDELGPEWESLRSPDMAAQLATHALQKQVAAQRYRAGRQHSEQERFVPQRLRLLNNHTRPETIDEALRSYDVDTAEELINGTPPPRRCGA